MGQESTTFRGLKPTSSSPYTSPIPTSSLSVTPTRHFHFITSLLGSARVPAGYQPPNSCQLLRLPARPDGQELAQHSHMFISDVAKRKMVLDAEVAICGWAKSILWGPRFKLHVDSHIVVDLLSLDVVDQKNDTRLELFAK